MTSEIRESTLHKCLLSFYFGIFMKNRSGNVFLYDSEDIRNPDERSIIQKKDWRYIAVILGFVLIIALFLIGLLVFAHIIIGSANIGLVKLGWAILIIIYGSLGTLLVGATMTGILYAYNWATKAGLINIMQHQAHVDKMRDVSERYMDVMQTRAMQSTFEGVKNLTYGHTISRVPQLAAPIDDTEEEEIIEGEIVMPTLEELKREGLIGRSGNSILLGMTDE